jgi:cytochrome c
MTTIFARPALMAALIALTGVAHAETAGDATKGAALFATHCSECHSVKEGKDKKGPSLYGILGAKAALREGFKYSDALKSSQIVWNAETLSRYAAAPRAVVPGGKMKYDGLADAAERADLIAYLAAQGKR